MDEAPFCVSLPTELINLSYNTAMRIPQHLFRSALIAGSAVTTLHAAELVRDAALIETIPIQGVTLAISPEEAVERLLAAGYAAGPVTSYQDWKEGELQFERGGPGAPEGESWVTLARHKGQLTQITEMTNQPGQRFDATAEIGAVRDHFGIAQDDPKCQANAYGSGNCRVQDAAEAPDVDLVFGVQVLAITMNRYAIRKKAYKKSLE